MLTKTQQVQSDHIIHVDRTIMSSMADPFDIWKRVHRLSERILGANLATEALEAWCRENAIGDGRVIALRAPDPAPETMDEESLEALYPYSPDKSARFRCVRLATAGTVIVNALNWYFPENLSRDICTKLDTTDIPFGRAVKHLHPKRRTFFVRRCAPEQFNDTEEIAPTFTAFEHRAVVYGGNGAPLAIVHERFLASLVLP